MRVVFWCPHPPFLLYRSGLCGTYQTSVWQPCCCGFCWERSRSLKLATAGLAPRNRSELWGRGPDHMDQRITGKGLEQDNIDIAWQQYSSFITGWSPEGRHCLCNDHRTTNAQIVGLLANYYWYGIEEEKPKCVLIFKCLMSSLYPSWGVAVNPQSVQANLSLQ